MIQYFNLNFMSNRSLYIPAYVIRKRWKYSNAVSYKYYYVLLLRIFIFFGWTCRDLPINTTARAAQEFALKARISPLSYCPNTTKSTALWGAIQRFCPYAATCSFGLRLLPFLSKSWAWFLHSVVECKGVQTDMLTTVPVSWERMRAQPPQGSDCCDATDKQTPWPWGKTALYHLSHIPLWGVFACSAPCFVGMAVMQAHLFRWHWVLLLLVRLHESVPWQGQAWLFISCSKVQFHSYCWGTSSCQGQRTISSFKI